MSNHPRETGRAPSTNPIIHIFAISLISAISLSCGKVGPPVPPLRFAERTSQLSAVQRGASMVLSWPAPALTAQQSSRYYIDHVNIYRLIERRDAGAVLDPGDYEELAQLVGVLDRAAIEEQTRSGANLQFTDVVDLSSRKELANIRLRYAVRYANKRGQEAAFSNTVAIEPSPGISAAPSGLRVALEAQDAITLQWDAPESNVDGSSPASVVGYNVYRHLAGRAGRALARQPLNPEPLTETAFTDKQFRYQATYVYTVRALSPGANGLIESVDSKLVQVTPVDRFKPGRPDPVSIASANGVISLFWPSSPERDVVGYNIYRAESEDAPEKDWIRLNAQPVTTVTFRDDRVVIGRKYFYRVTAIDRFDNESDPSGAVSETANP